MSIVERAKGILLNPKGTWPAIDAEPATVQSIYVPYVLALAAIPAIATFIGFSLVGMGAMGMSVRIPFGAGLVQMVVGYALSLVMIYVLALIVNALAPTFGGQKNSIAALKVVAYGATAGFLGGIFSLMPSLAILGMVAALYSIYLIYTGLPVLMKCPPGKAVAYTAVVIVCGIVAGVLIGMLTSLVSPAHRMGMGMGSAGGAGDMTIRTPQGEVKIDTSKMEEMARKMEEAGKQMEAAQKSGDGAAAGQAAAAMVGAMAGGQARAVVAAADLKALLPESIGGLKRASSEAQTSAAMGLASSVAKATYRGDDNQEVALTVTDTGGLAGLMAMAGWANLTTDHETDTQVEKIYKQGQRTVREQYRKDGSHGEYMVLLPNGMMVEAQGSGVDAARIRGAVEAIDLARLESMAPPAK